MKNQHVEPSEAIQIMMDCKAKQALGLHWGTFPLSDEGQQAPKHALTTALADQGFAVGRFVALEPGDVWNKPRSEKA